MAELPFNIQRAVRRYEPITTDGITLYPVLVAEYDLYSIGRTALEVMHQSLPVAMMRIPLLSALYRMDYEAAVGGETPTGLFSRTLLALALSLRLGEGEDIEGRIERFTVIVDREKPENLMCLRFTDQDGEEKEIRPVAYAKLREIIAAQNGVKLESDLANPDLVRAQKLAGSGGVSLDANADDLISGVAALSGLDENDILDWPILKLEKRTRSYRKLLDYLICGIGEVNGTTWNGGNPTPHPFFDRISDGSGFLKLMGEDEKRKTAPPVAAQIVAEQSKNL